MQNLSRPASRTVFSVSSNPAAKLGSASSRQLQTRQFPRNPAQANKQLGAPLASPAEGSQAQQRCLLRDQKVCKRKKSIKKKKHTHTQLPLFFMLVLLKKKHLFSSLPCWAPLARWRAAAPEALARTAASGSVACASLGRLRFKISCADAPHGRKFFCGTM